MSFQLASRAKKTLKLKKEKIIFSLMSKSTLAFYREFSEFTYPGLYKDNLKLLPNDIPTIAKLVRLQLIHRSTLKMGNTGTNADKKFGDMTTMPWYRQPEDDIFVTVGGMLTELYRRNPKGLIASRKAPEKLVLTCRFTTLLFAAILKSKNIPCRVRVGNAPYFNMGSLGEVSADHWLNQYWIGKRWVTIDVDGMWSINKIFDPLDIPEGTFDFPAQAWLDIQSGKDNPERFYNAKPEKGKIVVLWSLFSDFHSLMNNEIPYTLFPDPCSYTKFNAMTKIQKDQVDNLATLMLHPDKNFEQLRQIFETKKEFRLLQGGLLS